MTTLESQLPILYKGKGRDPLLAKNYRGISITLVIGKLFERILLQRLIPVLEDLGIPHYTQTAYQAGISCADPTEVDWNYDGIEKGSWDEFKIIISLKIFTNHNKNNVFWKGTVWST